MIKFLSLFFIVPALMCCHVSDVETKETCENCETEKVAVVDDKRDQEHKHGVIDIEVVNIAE